MSQSKKTIIIKKQRTPINPHFGSRRLSRQRDCENGDGGESNHGFLCFFLGLMLGPLGVIAAAVVGKAAGARFALSGFGMWLFIWLFFFR